jgi:hypothetical protein
MPNRPELQNKQTSEFQRTYRKGIMRGVKSAKRAEAEERNAVSPERKRRKYWQALGFSRESDAARERHKYWQSLRTRLGQDAVLLEGPFGTGKSDWSEDQDPATVRLLTEIFSPEPL